MQTSRNIMMNLPYWTVFGSRALLRLLLPLALLCPPADTTAAENRKTDIIYLKNGDRITGEFKEFLQGEVKLSTSDMGTIYIKWAAIDHLVSDKYIDFELADGQRLFGTVPASDANRDRMIEMQTLKESSVPLAMDTIVRAEQIRVNDSFWTRLAGYVSLGLNYTKSSDILTWNTNASAEYRTRKHLTTLSLDSTLTRKGDQQDEGTDTRRYDARLGRQWPLQNRWFLFSTAGAQRNDELGLESRIFATGGSGRYLKQSQKSELYLAAGLSANKEQTTGSSGTEPSDLNEGGANFEGVISFNWTFFRLYTPKSRVDFNTTVFPGISQSGRLRGTANINLRQEIVNDLFWELRTYLDYDNQPLQGAEAKEDYGVITSLGYEF
jgi:hypothetical protein